MACLSALRKSRQERQDGLPEPRNSKSSLAAIARGFCASAGEASRPPRRGETAACSLEALLVFQFLHFEVDLIALLDS